VHRHRTRHQLRTRRQLHMQLQAAVVADIKVAAVAADGTKL
jgi:hypothetical protein